MQRMPRGYILIICSHIIGCIQGSITRLGTVLLNFNQTLLVLLGNHVDGDKVVSVLILLWLFVIHVLSKFPDAGSVNVSKIRMVDSVLQECACLLF